MLASNSEFRKNSNGRWRFHFKDSRGEIDTKIGQKQLFLLHSNGHKGTWDNESKDRVKLWVSCLANTLIQQEADRLQIQFTVPRLKSFASLSAKSILWGEKRVDTGFTGALRAAYLSFASNLPTVASRHLDIAVKASNANKWSPDWCISILKELTFGPDISIYPARYNKIRPALERNYGVTIPDFAKELENWHSRFKNSEGIPRFTEVTEIQELLVRLGYDLGPSKVDGRMGPKTKDAIHTFQNLHGLFADSIVGPLTRSVFVDEWKRLDKKEKNE
ncbi:MAG TPA: peptidoglycan-binding protein [Ignavibacteria bacterium]|nr:peptidoglycan-binding protein [Ignavibacteria bacterium]